MSVMRITLQQLYVGLIEVLPDALGITGRVDWKMRLHEAVNGCIFSMKYDNTFLSEDIVETEKIILERVASIPDIEIIDLHESEE